MQSLHRRNIRVVASLPVTRCLAGSGRVAKLANRFFLLAAFLAAQVGLEKPQTTGKTCNYKQVLPVRVFISDCSSNSNWTSLIWRPLIDQNSPLIR
jgi:uncharacterized membrane protein